MKTFSDHLAHLCDQPGDFTLTAAWPFSRNPRRTTHMLVIYHRVDGELMHASARFNPDSGEGFEHCLSWCRRQLKLWEAA